MKAYEVILVFFFLFSSSAVDCNDSLPKLNFKQGNTNRKLGPCQACKLFISSFKDGMENTSRGKFEGGDAAWEEEKLRSYARSEVRLVEIQEKLCNSAKEHSDQCHAIAEEAEMYLEEWWFNKDSNPDDLHNYLCILKLQHCCPDRHYGKKCEPCTGGADNVCNGNGKCKGDGTRKGNGECICDAGYTGEVCNKCSYGFYEAYKDENKMLCSPCHNACKDGCAQGGVKGCSVCNDGWIMDTDHGCLDVNECLNESICAKDQFCVNTEGSFKCLSCDKSCESCTGDGPDMCNKCADGYKLNDNLCIKSNSVDSKVTLTRYLTYLGLCITVCIVFQKSIWLAGLFGLLVALYISTSEYVLANELASPEPTIDTSRIDWSSLLGKST